VTTNTYDEDGFTLTWSQDGNATAHDIQVLGEPQANITHSMTSPYSVDVSNLSWAGRDYNVSIITSSSGVDSQAVHSSHPTS
jgi:hypothetical protein